MSERTNDLIRQLQGLWSVEHLLVIELPKAIARATNFGLIKALEHHYGETQQHRTAIEFICKNLGVDPRLHVDEEFATLLADNELLLAAGEVNEVLIAGAQRVEQYEMQAYEAAAEEAHRAGLDLVRRRLLLTLEEERQASNKLNFVLKNLPISRHAMRESAVAFNFR